MHSGRATRPGGTERQRKAKIMKNCRTSVFYRAPLAFGKRFSIRTHRIRNNDIYEKMLPNTLVGLGASLCLSVRSPLLVLAGRSGRACRCKRHTAHGERESARVPSAGGRRKFYLLLGSLSRSLVSRTRSRRGHRKQNKFEIIRIRISVERFAWRLAPSTGRSLPIRLIPLLTFHRTNSIMNC